MIQPRVIWRACVCGLLRPRRGWRDFCNDRSGAVARRGDSGWEQRVDGKWQADDAAQARDKAAQARDKAATVTPQQKEQARARVEQKRPEVRQPQIDRRDLNRSYEARQRGTQREMNRPAARNVRRR